MKNENPEEWYGTHPSDPDARRNNFTFPGLHSQQESNQKEDTRKPEARVNFDAIARCELLDPSSHEESNQKKGNGNQAAKVNLSAIAKQVLRDYNSDEESEQEEDNRKPVAIIRKRERSHSLEESNQQEGNGNQAARVDLTALTKQALRDYNSDEESEQEEDNKKPVAIIRNHERSHSLESSVFSFEYSDTN